MTMRDTGLLALRLTLGGYLAAHGAQKLFGSFDGPGLDAAGAGFDHLGLRPGKGMAALAAGSELVGGVLTAAGAASPAGPVAIAGAMAAASSVHGDKGPLSANGGYELPMTNLAAALALATTGPGRYSIDGLTGLRLPPALAKLMLAGTAALSAYSISRVVTTRRARATELATSTPATTAMSTGDAEHVTEEPTHS
jgi:putative oxidoreductase